MNTPPKVTTSAFKTVNLTAGSAYTIQAEDYDNGAEGSAFHDITSTNDGGQYRKTAVDVEKSGDTGGGYDLTNVKMGEWVNYTVNVTKTGTFNLDTRVASAFNGASFHVEVDGKNVTGSLKFLNTGSFQKWATVRKGGISLTAGKHTLKLVIDSAGGHKYAGQRELDQAELTEFGPACDPHPPLLATQRAQPLSVG